MIPDFLHTTRFRLRNLLEDRRPRDGILGIPALLAGLLLVGMILQTHFGRSPEHLESQEHEAQRHLEKGRYVEAHLTAMRLTQADPQSQKAILLEAKALRGMGREMEATRLLARIAPIDRPGYAPAHVLQSAILLAQKQPNLPAAQKHFILALQSDPANQDAHELAARFAAGADDWKNALRHLTQIDTAKRPDLLLMKATALQFTGSNEEAIKVAGKAETALRSIHDPAAPESDHVRFSIAVSLSLQRQFEKAIQWVLGSIKNTPTKEERQVIAGIYLSWSRHLKEQSPPDRSTALHLLEKGIQLCPDSQDLIMAFLGDCDDITSNSEERHRYITQVLSRSGIATSFMHYYLGVHEWKQGDKTSARDHFELASKLHPGFGIISNNLAMAIAAVSEDKNELEKALTIMNGLLDQEGENPFYLDTRSHVLTKLGRPKDALRDLEHALPHASDKSSTHRRIAQIYQDLHMPELAEEHLKQGQVLATTRWQ